jgi:hypothetical protein
MKKLFKTALSLAAIVIGIGVVSLSTDTVQAYDYSYEAFISSHPDHDVTGWNIQAAETEVVTGSAFTYHAYPSNDNQNAWIYKIDVDINQKENAASMAIPEKINGKTVTRLGWVLEPKADKTTYILDFNSNIFGEVVEKAHGVTGSFGGVSLITQMSIPDSVAMIQQSCFSGMSNLKKIVIPDGVETIPREMLYGCRSLKEVRLPRSLKEFSAEPFDDCNKISSFTIDSANTKYAINGKCIVEKDTGSLVLCFASGKKYNIPKGIKTLKKDSFNICRAKRIHIPASVTKIEGYAFSSYIDYTKRYVQDVTVDKKNKVYARDGQSIYNKKDGTLSISILNKKNYKMSDKVKKLTEDQNYVVGGTPQTGVKNLFVSKNLKVVGYMGWGVVQNYAKNIYYTGMKTPKIMKSAEGYARLPIFKNIYVPKKANKKYIKMYKKYKEYDSVDSWHTY